MISEEVRALRVSVGMNRKEFCEYFDILYRTMSDWEAGKRKMPEYLLKRMEHKAERVQNHGHKQKRILAST